MLTTRIKSIMKRREAGGPRKLRQENLAGKEEEEDAPLLL